MIGCKALRASVGLGGLAQRHARIGQEDPHGARQRPGAFFGEMSLLDGGPRSATIVAETPIRLLVISRRNFSVLLKEVPGLTQSLLVTLSRRVRQAEERAERMGGALAGL